MYTVQHLFGKNWTWELDVKHPRFLDLCIRRTPDLSVKICVKKCVLYTQNYGNRIRCAVINHCLTLLDYWDIIHISPTTIIVYVPQNIIKIIKPASILASAGMVVFKHFQKLYDL